MSELKKCPFCGGTKICTEKGINLNYCDNCSAESNVEHWNTRPIEDALTARIAELEAENDRLQSGWFRDETICPDGSLKPKVSDLLNRIAELEAAQRWIPVSERLPQIGVRVLFYNNFIKNIHKGWYSGDEWVSDIGVFYNGDKLKRITHWMPLSTPPEVQE